MCCEALDVAMDVFGADDGAAMHQAYLALGAHARIGAAVAALKAKLRAGGVERAAMDRGAAAAAKEVVLNAGRFLKYKAKNFPGLA